MNGSFNTAGNWSPAAVPTAVATFATSNVTSITTGLNTAVGEFLFNTGASAFSFSQNSGGFAFNGAGIVNNSGVTQTYDNTASSLGLIFQNSASASAGNSNVIITNENTITFQNSSTGGSATITNGSAANTGTITFLANSTGGNAAFINNAGSTIDFSQSTGPNANNQLSAGSIAGAGIFSLGANTLTVGSDNTSTTVSGVIADGGAGGGTGGSLVKTGTGTLTLTGMNTYTGTTTIMQGVLLLNGSLHMSDTTVAGGTLAGFGTVQNLTVNSGATVAPGMVDEICDLERLQQCDLQCGFDFTVNINSAGQHDFLNVGGTATINGGTVIANALGGTGITTASTFIILGATKR